MASEDPVKELCDAMICPLCQDYFRDPVMLDCGHNFCRACMLQYWVGSNMVSACPECRTPFQQVDARSNWHLANIVPLVKKLQEGQRTAEKIREVCERHQKPLRFFCRDDEAPLCVTCKRTKVHRAHVVVLVDEAAQELKEKIKAQLKSMEEEREKRVSQKTPNELESLEWLPNLVTLL